MIEIPQLHKISALIRYYIITSTTRAGSGHPSSSLSAVELMSVLMFAGFFKYDIENPDHPNNDRLLFSKGHASPLFYSLWTAAGGILHDELKTMRKFGSRLEGHPTMEFPFTEVPSGSLGQGLSVGVGIALNAKYLDKLPYKTYVLLGDSEMAEGSNWEAIQSAAYYKLDNLIGILDVNRLGQRGETMHGHDVDSYKRKMEAFDWNAIVINGNEIEEVIDAYEAAHANENGKPTMIIAKTLKGKGVSFIENKDGWHGKTLSKDEEQLALTEIGNVEVGKQYAIKKPHDSTPNNPEQNKPESKPDTSLSPDFSEPTATRKAYGFALNSIYQSNPNMVVLDSEVSNSTYSEIFAKAHPEHFFEMFISEQNMVGVALGLATRHKIPFISTFAAFLTRAADQIRMAQYSKRHINIVGSHAGVSIGEDGSSQMGLEDISLFRALLGSTVLYPSDAISTEKLVHEMARHSGICYMRTTRMATDPLYTKDDIFKIGGSKVLRTSDTDVVTVIAAGITLHETLKAYKQLRVQNINIRVIDMYSIKPLDRNTLYKASNETGAIITVEDHFAEGGLGEAVAHALAHEESKKPIYICAVRKMPKSGTPDELLDYEEISAAHIVEKVLEIINNTQ